MMGDASISNNQVVLTGNSGSFVNLPGGLITGYQSTTIDCWATFGTLENWCYVFAFGTDNLGSINGGGFGQNYVQEVARNGGTGHRIDHAGGAAFDMNGLLSSNAVHITAVVDPTTGILACYTNGVKSGVATTDFNPLSNIATNFCFIGHSLWSADGYLPAAIDEFRIYKGALTPQQIAMADRSGPNNTNIDPGALQSIAIQLPTNMVIECAVVPGMLVNYANLPNYNLVANAFAPPTDVIFTSSASNVLAYNPVDGLLHSFAAGTATITVTYQGHQSSQLVTVTRPPPRRPRQPV